MVKLTIEEYKEFKLLSELIPYGLVMTLIDGEGIIIDNYYTAIGEYILTSAAKAVGKKYH